MPKISIVPTEYKQTYSACNKIPKNIIDKMFKELKETIKDKKEHGFLICSGARRIENINDKNTITGKSCIGAECEVEIPGKCPKNMDMKGIFHTHPAGINYPSRLDMLYATTKKYKFLCIGANSQIRCMPSGISIKYVPRTGIPRTEEEFKEFLRYKDFWDRHITDCIILK